MAQASGRLSSHRRSSWVGLCVWLLGALVAATLVASFCMYWIPARHLDGAATTLEDAIPSRAKSCRPESDGGWAEVVNILRSLHTIDCASDFALIYCGDFTQAVCRLPPRDTRLVHLPTYGLVADTEALRVSDSWMQGIRAVLDRICGMRISGELSALTLLTFWSLIDARLGASVRLAEPSRIVSDLEIAGQFVDTLTCVDGVSAVRQLVDGVAFYLAGLDRNDVVGFESSEMKEAIRRLGAVHWLTSEIFFLSDARAAAKTLRETATPMRQLIYRKENVAVARSAVGLPQLDGRWSAYWHRASVEVGDAAHAWVAGMRVFDVLDDPNALSIGLHRLESMPHSGYVRQVVALILDRVILSDEYVRTILGDSCGNLPIMPYDVHHWLERHAK